MMDLLDILRHILQNLPFWLSCISKVSVHTATKKAQYVEVSQHRAPRASPDQSIRTLGYLSVSLVEKHLTYSCSCADWSLLID